MFRSYSLGALLLRESWAVAVLIWSTDHQWSTELTWWGVNDWTCKTRFSLSSGQIWKIMWLENYDKLVRQGTWKKYWENYLLHNSHQIFHELSNSSRYYHLHLKHVCSRVKNFHVNTQRRGWWGGGGGGGQGGWVPREKDKEIALPRWRIAAHSHTHNSPKVWQRVDGTYLDDWELSRCLTSNTLSNCLEGSWRRTEKDWGLVIWQEKEVLNVSVTIIFEFKCAKAVNEN